MDLEDCELGATPQATRDGRLQEAPAFPSGQSMDLFRGVLDGPVSANSDMLRTYLDTNTPVRKPRDKMRDPSGRSTITTTYKVTSSGKDSPEHPLQADKGLRSEKAGGATSNEKLGVVEDNVMDPDETQDRLEMSGNQLYGSTCYINPGSAVDLRQVTLDEALTQWNGDKSEVIASRADSKSLTCSI